MKTIMLNIMDATEAFAEPGALSIVDCINPQTGRSWINNETLEQIRERYPKAERVNMADWMAAKAARQASPIIWIEISEEKYDEMLNVLPPAAWISGGFLVGEPSDHLAITGAPRFEAFRRHAGRFETTTRPLTKAEFRGEMGGATHGQSKSPAILPASQRIRSHERRTPQK